MMSVDDGETDSKRRRGGDLSIIHHPLWSILSHPFSSSFSLAWPPLPSEEAERVNNKLVEDDGGDGLG